MDLWILIFYIIDHLIDHPSFLSLFLHYILVLVAFFFAVLEGGIIEGIEGRDS